MNDIAKRLITLRIKAKARHLRGSLRHDPEPNIPDLAQNVGSPSFSLLIDMPRHGR